MEKVIKYNFRKQLYVVFALFGTLPGLLVLFLLYDDQIVSSVYALTIAAVALFVQLFTFYLLYKHYERLLEFTQSITSSHRAGKYYPITTCADSSSEFVVISEHVNQLISELDESKKNFSEVTISLMKHTKDASIAHQESLSKSKEREEMLTPYIGSKIIDHLIHRKSLKDDHINHRMNTTVLFTDVRAFTTISESSEPEEAVSMLNEYFELMVDVIHKHHGILDKFIGDELMAVFGFNQSPNKTSVDAINAAIEMQVVTRQLMRQRENQGKVTFTVGIGINSGTVIAGDIGSKTRRDYTVIGDNVNVASRLVQIAAGGEILISRQTFNECGELFITERKGRIQVKNRKKEVEYFKILSKASNI